MKQATAIDCTASSSRREAADTRTGPTSVGPFLCLIVCLAQVNRVTMVDGVIVCAMLLLAFGETKATRPEGIKTPYREQARSRLCVDNVTMVVTLL